MRCFYCIKQRRYEMYVLKAQTHDMSIILNRGDAIRQRRRRLMHSSASQVQGSPIISGPRLPRLRLTALSPAITRWSQQRACRLPQLFLCSILPTHCLEVAAATSQRRRARRPQSIFAPYAAIRGPAPIAHATARTRLTTNEPAGGRTLGRGTTRAPTCGCASEEETHTKETSAPCTGPKPQPPPTQTQANEWRSIKQLDHAPP